MNIRRHELHPYTAIVNRAQKLESKKKRQDALAWMVKTFPKAFDVTHKIQPLKCGILTDLLEQVDEALKADETLSQVISKTKVREALVYFIRNNLAYQICLQQPNEERIDLYGNPAGFVTEEEAEKARHKLRKKIEKGARNAKKTTGPKMGATPVSPSPVSSYAAQGRNTAPTAYPTKRKPLYSMPDSPQPSKLSPIITHKASRQFDPDAVARLKERLGLSRKLDEKESTE